MGERLDNEETVFRVLRASKDGRALEVHFEPTSSDKQSPRQSLSVWAERLTTAPQARAFLGDKAPLYEVYARPQPRRVRALMVPALPPAVLDVVWDRLLADLANEDLRPVE